MYIGCINQIHAQKLDTLIKQAFEHNPELKALQYEYEAALQKGPQVSQLQDPTLGLGIPVLRPETRLGGQVLMVTASQMFPWFGTLSAKNDVAISMARTKYENIAAIRLDLIYEIKNAYYNLFLLQEEQRILKKHERIFTSLENVSLSKVESGKSLASDVLSVRIKLEEIQNQIEILEQQKTSFYAQLAAVRNNSQVDTIQIIDTLASISPTAFDLDLYRQKIQSHHPLLKKLDWQIETSNKELDLNELLGKPSFGVGLDYSLVAQRTDAFPASNGRDILIPKVMASIPINRKKYGAKAEEERLIQASFQMQKEHITNKMISLLQSYQADRESASLRKQLAEKQQYISDRAYDILLAEYSTSGLRFDELMKLQNDRINYELDIIKAIVQSHMAEIKIDRLTDF
jgi:outer membrane protein TolC